MFKKKTVCNTNLFLTLLLVPIISLAEGISVEVPTKTILDGEEKKDELNRYRIFCFEYNKSTECELKIHDYRCLGNRGHFSSNNYDSKTGNLKIKELHLKNKKLSFDYRIGNDWITCNGILDIKKKTIDLGLSSKVPYSEYSFKTFSCNGIHITIGNAPLQIIVNQREEISLHKFCQNNLF